MIFGVRRTRNLRNAEQMLRLALEAAQSLLVAQQLPLEESALMVQALLARAALIAHTSSERHQRLLEIQARLDGVMRRVAELRNRRNDLHL